jgi:hypothetical protein
VTPDGVVREAEKACVAIQTGLENVTGLQLISGTDLDNAVSR